MKLREYFTRHAISQSALAKEVGAHPVTMSQWVAEDRRVPAKYCPAIERATAGSVRCEDLRPDVDWAYLRGTALAHHEAA